MKKLIYIILTLFVLQIVACVSCQMFTYDLDDIEKPYFLWLKEGAVQKFVSTKNDTTIFTITKIEKKTEKPEWNIPIIGGGDFFHAITNFYGYCRITGDTQSIKLKNGIYIYIEKLKQSYIRALIYIGNQDEYQFWLFLPSGVRKLDTSGSITLLFLDTVVVEKRQFTDTEFFKQRDSDGRGIVSYIWSKRYGLLQYTTADSLVWTRINIPEE